MTTSAVRCGPGRSYLVTSRTVPDSPTADFLCLNQSWGSPPLATGISIIYSSCMSHNRFKINSILIRNFKILTSSLSAMNVDLTSEVTGEEM